MTDLPSRIRVPGVPSERELIDGVLATDPLDTR
jgi:hypothetical protein